MYYLLRKNTIALALIVSAVAVINPAAASGPVVTIINSETISVGRNDARQQIMSMAEDESSLVESKITLQGGGLFAFNSGALGKNSEKALVSLISRIEQLDKVVSINVIGHSDSIGAKKNNMQLSVLRAKTVQAFLRGAYPEIPIKALGLGDTNPAHTNTTAEGRSLNRRVDVIVSTAK